MKTMKYTFCLVVFAALFNFKGFSQNSINDYKYIIVPNQFDFLREANQYQINSLVEFLFNKYGFTALMEGKDYPQDLKNNSCLALTAKVEEHKAFLNTKLQIHLIDCNKKVVMSSKIGQSREKEYAKAYNLAIRDAFETFQNANYHYQPNAVMTSKASATTSDGAEVSAANAEIERLKNELQKQKALTKTETKTKQVEVTMIPKQQLSEAIETLYAQPIENGYQIVDTTPKKIMVLYASGVADTFIVKDKNAIIYKKDGLWIYAENNGSELKTEVLNIKF